MMEMGLVRKRPPVPEEDMVAARQTVQLLYMRAMDRDWASQSVGEP